MTDHNILLPLSPDNAGSLAGDMTDVDFERMRAAIDVEQAKRWFADPSREYVSLQAGFSRSTGGTICYYVGTRMDGTPTGSPDGATWKGSYHAFARRPGGEPCWMIELDERIQDKIAPTGRFAQLKNEDRDE